MKNENVMDLRAKIIKGLDLAFSRLLVAKQKEGADLVISKEGKIVKVKAIDLIK
ncbi:MAG: hypothetical protein Q8R57_07280 [Bacteroidota bacterium]|jgi:hypothetical protein|nr:hypothetical protein [Bacteroidota bacterium]